MKATTNYALWFNEAVAAVAREAFQRMCRESGAFYLYFQPHGLRFYVVGEGETAPEGAETVTGERIPSHLTVQQLTARFHDLCRRVPVLPAD